MCPPKKVGRLNIKSLWVKSSVLHRTLSFWSQFDQVMAVSVDSGTKPGVYELRFVISDCSQCQCGTKQPPPRNREGGVRVRIGGFEPSTSCLSSKRSKPTELNPHISTKRKHKARERTAKINIFEIFSNLFQKPGEIS